MHQGLVAIRSFVLVSTAVFLLLPTPAAQAQLVTNPVVAEFIPSVNQNAIGPDGQPLVASYELRFYMIGAAAPFQSGSIGRPATQSDGKIRVMLASVFFGLPSPGILYEARVAAIGPGGTSISNVSNSFVYSVPCTVTVATASMSMAAAAGTSSQIVTTGAGCAWTAGSSAAWLTVVSAARGTGPGTVTIAVTANAAASPRSGTLTIGDHTVLVTQSGTPCTVGVTPTAQAAGAAAGSGTIAVTAGPGCGWTATSGAAWLTIASGATGSANGTVAYNIVANTIASSRVGTLSIGGRTVTVSQAAAPAPLPGAPASPSPATGAAAVSTAANLTWTATGATSYDVRLGTSTPPVTVAASNLTAAAYAPALVAGTKYFWQVVGRNSAGTTAGPVWSLTTAGLPAPWTSQDIGTVGVVGSATYGNGIFTVGGGGLDIWGTADAFRYVSQPLVGDATVVARVTALQNTHGNAKAGVMMRGALTAAAAHVMINAAVDGGIEFISRSSAGSAATYLGGGMQPAPAWLKLARVGSTVTGSVSRDGQVWTVVGSTSVAGLAYTGLVVTSADPALRNLSTFDAVTVSASTR
jgi:Putative binding domain, N-terminal/Viral BACON domain